MSDESESREPMPEPAYTMSLSQHLEMNQLAYEDNLTMYEGDFGWRRHLVHDLYHSLRAQGDSHEEAVGGLLKALPRLFLDENQEAYLDE